MGEESVGRVAIYLLFFRRPHRRNNTLGDYAGDSVGHSDEKSTRHRTDLLFKSLGDSVGIFYSAPVMSLVRICHFKFVGASVDILNGESVPSHVRVTRFESVGDFVGKITYQNLHVSYRPFFH